VREGGPEAAAAFLQKPFAMGAFARKVREILDAPRSDGGGGVEPSSRAA
jgi:hypothetical protein